MPLSLKDFISRYNGKRVSGYSASGGQCGDLARTWVKNLTGDPYHGLPPTGNQGVRQFWYTSDPGKWRKVPWDHGRIPPSGALVIFNAGNFGHVAIARDGSTTDACKTFDQNWSRERLCTLESHRYTAHGCLGWLILPTQTIEVTPTLVKWTFQLVYGKAWWQSPAFYSKVREKLRVACRDFINEYGYDPRGAAAFFRKFLANRNIP